MKNILENTYIRVLLIAAIVIVALVIGYSIGNKQSEESDQPSGTPTPTETEVPTDTPEPTATQNPAEGEVQETQLITTPTIGPTATPGAISEFVEEFSTNIGADEVEVLGLSGEDWINILVSIGMFLLLLFLVSRVVLLILRGFVRSTATGYDDLLLEKTSTQITWFLGVMGLQFGSIRLAFLDPVIKQYLNQFYSSLYIIIATIFLWKGLDVVVEWYGNEVETKRDEQHKDTILLLVHRIGRFFLVVVSVVMILSINNVNVDVLLASLGIVGLAFSLAAQDSLANLISGVLISLDQPFRVGDRIEIQALGTWGDVVDIGLRSTRIRTRDNRLVIVPNSQIGSDQVINYSYPDPKYRIQMEINLHYGEEVENVRAIIIKAVRGVEGVLPDQPVEALYVEMGGTGMVFRIRWWIESYIDTRRMFDKVNTALQAAFDDAGIEIPNPAYDLNIFDEQDGESASSLDNPGPG